MKKVSLPLAIIILVVVLTSHALSGPAKIWEEKIVIPTYQVKPPDPNPHFYDGRVTQGAKGKVYPFAMSDALTGVKKDQIYQAVYLENQYIKLCVLPELGGRLYSAVDKTNGYDYFYKQQVIKPTLIGTLGAWISGGSEWNFPHHHKATTMMRMDYLVKENADGSATLWLAETERRHRFRITLAMTIRPDNNVLELWINPYNPTPYIHSFLFFANPSVHVDPTYQVIFPPSVEWVTQHAKREFISWPIANGRYGDKEYENVDISWWKNLPKAVSFFAWNEDDNFFAGYDHGKDAGTAYVANHHLTPGMKFFTFGCGPEGVAWDKMLTDEDGPYLELMAGAFSDNQPDYSWSQPFENKWVKQHWFPIRDLDNLTYANLSGALNLDIDSQNQVTIQVNTTSPQSKAHIILSAQGKELLRKTADIDPAHPFEAKLQFSSVYQTTDLQLKVENAQGQTLMAYRPQAKKGDPMPQAVVAPRQPQDYKTVEELYFTGLRLDQFYNAQIDAMPYYQEALSRDPGNYLVNTQLGINALKGMDWDKAASHLEKAVSRVSANEMRSKYGEPLFYYGLALRELGKTKQAKDILYRATWSAGWKSNAYFALAEMASTAGDYDEALAHINRSLETNGQNLRAANLKAILLRTLARPQEALQVVEGILDRNPMDLQARNEQIKLAEAMNDKAEAKEQLDQLNKMMKAEPETFLELACLYENVGQWQEAVEVLTRIGTARHAVVQYHLGYASAQAGKLKQAKRYYKKAAGIKADYGFPYRPETLDALLHAASLSQQDANVRLLLGNMLYDSQPKRAIRYWKTAAQLDPKRSLVFRNLGFAYDRRADFATSIDYYQKALSLNKTDARLLYELDIILEKNKNPLEERLAIMAAHEKVLDDRIDSLSRQVLANIQAANYDKAIALLKTNHFYRWEGAREIRDYYMDPHLLRGLQAYQQGRYADALKDFKAADEYPENLEMGRPAHAPQFAKVHYLIAMACEALGQKQEAKAYLEKSANQGDRSLETLYYRVLALRKLGRTKWANELAGTLQADSQNEETVNFFAKFGEKRTPDMKMAQFHYIRGLALLTQAGSAEEATKHFAKAVELNPLHYWAKSFLQGTAPLVVSMGGMH